MAESEFDADTVREIHEIHAMLSEALPLLRRAAPLLDSPMVKMATGGGVLSLMQRGPRRG